MKTHCFKWERKFAARQNFFNKSKAFQPRYLALYTILQVDGDKTYLVEQNGHVSQESDSRLKTYYREGPRFVGNQQGKVWLKGKNASLSIMAT